MAVKFGNKAAGAKSAGPQAVKSPASAQGKGASLLPEDWSQGGGLASDIDVLLTDLTWVNDWTYNGKIDNPVFALRITMQKEDGVEEIQHLSAGDVSKFTPSADGKRAVGNTDGAQLNDNTNAATFLASIMEAGFPKAKVEDSVAIFEGMDVHVMRIAQKKRTGLVVEETGGRGKEVLTVQKINRLPWEKAGKVAAKQPAAKNGVASAPAAAAAEAEEGEGVDSAAIGAVLVKVLEDKGGSVAFKGLSVASLKHLVGNTQRADILLVLKDAEQLMAVCEAEGLTFDGETLSA